MAAMNAEELVRLHLEAMFLADDEGRLLAVNEPWDQSRPAPLAYRVAGPAGKARLHLRAGLPQAAARRVLVLAGAGEGDPEAYRAALGGGRVSRALCYCFPAEALGAGLAAGGLDGAEGVAPALSAEGPSAGCLALRAGNLAEVDLGAFPWLAGEVATAQPCLVLAPQGRVLAVCRCVRIGQSGGHEAGIETDPACRRRGYARLVLAAWEAAVRRQGGVPLYSTLVENTASQGLAAAVGLVQYAGGFSVW